MKIKTIGSLLSLPLFLTSYTNGSHTYLDLFDSSAAITKNISF